MTAQEVFETVAEHLFTQGWRALADNMCMYRDREGRKCAVGCLIDDEDYRPEMERLPVKALCRNFKEVLPPTILSNVYLLMDLQQVHDEVMNWGSSDQMRQELTSTAKKHELDAAFLVGLSFRDR